MDQVTHYRELREDPATPRGLKKLKMTFPSPNADLSPVSVTSSVSSPPSPDRTVRIRRMAASSDVTTSALSSCGRGVVRVTRQIPAILLGTAFAVLDNVPYGLLIFHSGDKGLSALGATMVMETTIVAQAVLACFSTFPFGVGACIVENIPFLSAMSRSIDFQMTQRGLPAESIISTIIAAFALATLCTSVAFWLLGRLEVGSFTEFVPKHVLLGCISGMGIFIVFAAVGVASGTAWVWKFETIWKQFETGPAIRWSITVGLEVFLLAVGPKVDSIFFVPCFLLMTPVVFYVALYYCGISVQAAREAGWLFDLMSYAQPSGGVLWKDILNNFNVWRIFSPTAVDWSVLSHQMTTIFAIVFFSVVHPPLNCPALSLQTGIHADLNKEFKVHSAANFIASLFGGAQNYMTYSSSILLSSCGMVDRWASAMVALLSSFFIMVGPAVALSFFPLPAAAIFLMHVGMVLVKDGVVESFPELDSKEYFVVWVIAIAMQWDFMQGIAIGAVVSVFTFLVHLSRLNVASEPLSGSGLRSNQLRPRRETELLDELMDQLVVLRLKGNLFFGNAQQLLTMTRELYDKSRGMYDIRFLMIDCSVVVDIDCTAVDKFASIARIAQANGSVLVFAGMGDVIIERASCWQSEQLGDSTRRSSCSGNGEELGILCGGTIDHPVRFFATTSAALFWCEEQLLLMADGLTLAGGSRSSSRIMKSGGSCTASPFESIFALDLPPHGDLGDTNWSPHNSLSPICLKLVISEASPKSLSHSSANPSPLDVGQEQKHPVTASASQSSSQAASTRFDSGKPPKQLRPGAAPPSSAAATESATGLSSPALTFGKSLASASESARSAPAADPCIVQLFQLISDAAPQVDLSHLAGFFSGADFGAGCYLWREGDPATFLCVVRHGLLGVERRSSSPNSIKTKSDALIHFGTAGRTFERVLNEADGGEAATTTTVPPFCPSFSIGAPQRDDRKRRSVTFGSPQCAASSFSKSFDATSGGPPDGAASVHLTPLSCDLQPRTSTLPSFPVTARGSDEDLPSARSVGGRGLMQRARQRNRLHSTDGCRNANHNSSRVFTSSPLSPTLGSNARRTEIWQCFSQPLMACASPASAFGSRRQPDASPAVVVDHPVWNKPVCIHRAPYSEYFVAGQLVGELTTVAGARRGAAVVAVHPTSVLILTHTTIKRMQSTEPQLLCALQSIILRSASQRLGNSARFCDEALLI